MVNYSLASLALIAAMAFYFVFDDAMQSRVVEVKPESIWHCDGWAGVKYPNVKRMREAVK